ncbi:MAG: hypothetical protein ACJ8AO_21620 [Gemmatimonadaceae bacterium]
MRSPADARTRRLLELALRIAALGLLGWQLARELTPAASPRPRTVTLKSSELSKQLPELTLAPHLARLHVEADTLPGRVSRAWLAALARTGTRVSWQGDAMPLAVAAEPTGESAGGTRLLVAARHGALVRVGDAAGVIDSVRVRGGGASVGVASLAGAAWAQAGGTRAVAAPADSALARGVLLFGRPSWETRFVTAALEEAGWKVSLRTPLAPGRMVEQGSVALDTARTAAVVALDSSAAAQARAIAGFVRDGGGLIVTSEAASAVPAFAALAPGVAGALAGAVDAGADSVDRAGLALRAVTPLRDGAVALERRGATVAVAARRVDAGRVAQVGYADTWRWRMSGGDGGAAAHRRWWSALVASVAYLPTVAAAPADASDAAPLAAMVGALGEPTASPPRSTGRAPLEPPRTLLFASVVTLLLAEWLSRRLRGAR